MRKALAFSAAGTLRAVVLGGVLSAIFAGPGCTRQTFDLLQDATGGAKGGASTAGATSSAGGSVAGDRGHESGGGGASSFGGSSGGVTMDAAGSPNQEPCLTGESCVDGGLPCPPSEPSCRRCTANTDCDGQRAPVCDVADGRCAECLVDGNCRADEVCHPLTKRCLHHCNTSADCVNENQAPQCDNFHTCVACLVASDCRQILGHNGECAFGSCVDCFDDRQCPTDRPHCSGLHCSR
jgi:hypothetical protein